MSSRFADFSENLEPSAAFTKTVLDTFSTRRKFVVILWRFHIGVNKNMTQLNFVYRVLGDMLKMFNVFLSFPLIFLIVPLTSKNMTNFGKLSLPFTKDKIHYIVMARYSREIGYHWSKEPLCCKIG